MSIQWFVIQIFILFPFFCFADEEIVELQFVSFPKSSKAMPVELLIGENKAIQVEIPTNSISPVYKVKKSNYWMVGKMSIKEDGETSWEKYGSTKSIDADKQLILLIRKGNLNSDGFTMTVLDNRKSNFGGGKYLFMNAAKVETIVKIGDKALLLKPRSIKLIKPSPSKVKGKRKYLYVTNYYRHKKKTVPFYTSTWRYSEKTRSMVFFYHDPHTNQLRTHSIREYLTK